MILKWIVLFLSMFHLTIGDPFKKYSPFYGKKVLIDAWTNVVDKGIYTICYSSKLCAYLIHEPLQKCTVGKVADTVLCGFICSFDNGLCKAYQVEK